MTGKVWIVTRKELRDPTRRPGLLSGLVLPPLLLAALPGFVAAAITHDPRALEQLQAAKFSGLDVAGLAPAAAATRIVVAQFAAVYLLLPTMLSSVMASYSVVGEKVARTLEPLLATPVTVRELVLGKTLAVTIPALLATVASATVGAAFMIIVSHPDADAWNAICASWPLALGVVTPPLTLAADLLMLLVSARARDPRSAQQAAVLLILPIVGIIASQAAFRLVLGPSFYVTFSLVLGAIDVVILLVARPLFGREQILSKLG